MPLKIDFRVILHLLFDTLLSICYSFGDKELLKISWLSGSSWYNPYELWVHLVSVDYPEPYNRGLYWFRRAH